MRRPWLLGGLTARVIHPCDARRSADTARGARRRVRAAARSARGRGAGRVESSRVARRSTRRGAERIRCRRDDPRPARQRRGPRGNRLALVRTRASRGDAAAASQLVARAASAAATSQSKGREATPDRPQAALVAAQLAVVSANLPATWLGVDCYYRPVESRGGSVRAVLDVVERRGSGRVAGRALPPALSGLTQRALLLNAEFWRALRAPRVLWFEPGTTLLCGRAPLALDDPLFEAWDWARRRRGGVPSRGGAAAVVGSEGASSRSRESSARRRRFAAPSRCTDRRGDVVGSEGASSRSRRGGAAAVGSSARARSDASRPQVGAPWKWAAPGAPHSVGGNGALSLRTRDALVALLDGGATPPSKGNEDMWHRGPSGISTRPLGDADGRPTLQRKVFASPGLRVPWTLGRRRYVKALGAAGALGPPLGRKARLAPTLGGNELHSALKMHEIRFRGPSEWFVTARRRRLSLHASLSRSSRRRTEKRRPWESSTSCARFRTRIGASSSRYAPKRSCCFLRFTTRAARSRARASGSSTGRCVTGRRAKRRAATSARWHFDTS